MDRLFIDMQPISRHCQMNILRGDKLPQNGLMWELNNEIKPVDIYCYLNAKYCPPNGMLSMPGIKADDSDNLIHWDWIFAVEFGLVWIQGHNYRTEVHLMGDFKDRGLTASDFVNQLKKDFGKYGKAITKFRTELERWSHFVNPHIRVRNAIDKVREELLELNLSLDSDGPKNPVTYKESQAFAERWKEESEKYSYAVALGFSFRAMLPILAESFLNLFIFLLVKPEIRSDADAFAKLVRLPIHERVLKINETCREIYKEIKISDDEYKKFHSLMNERNNFIHGNVDIPSLTFDEVYFQDRTPLFNSYSSFWQQSVGVSVKQVKLDSVERDYYAVQNFIDWLVGHVHPFLTKQLYATAEKVHLGYNKKTNRVGVLFPEAMADFRGYVSLDGEPTQLDLFLNNS